MKLELRQYKNNSVLSKKNYNVEIAAVFHYLHGKGKSAANSKLEYFWTEWSRSYIALTLLSA